jgi:transaldolase
MVENYFGWLAHETPSRVWINNPTQEEIGLALAQGAVACTTNPAYGGNLLKRAPDEIESDIAAIVAEGANGDAAVARVQARLVARILPHFLPCFEASGGREGWVSFQGAPELDTEVEHILEAAHVARGLGVNCIPKIPATGPGLEALDRLVREGCPTLMTEVFSLAQVTETCERYLRAADESGQHPMLIMAPITGIFGDHLRKLADRDGLAVSPMATRWAGVTWARAAKRLVDERGYPVQLLYGGARTTEDLTGLVGGPHAATVNWSTFEEVLEADPERRMTVGDPPPADILESLTATFDDFRRALDIDGLEVEEFEGFGPVQHFRDAFIAGWTAVRDEVGVQRSARSGDAGQP